MAFPAQEPASGKFVTLHTGINLTDSTYRMPRMARWPGLLAGLLLTLLAIALFTTATRLPFWLAALLAVAYGALVCGTAVSFSRRTNAAVRESERQFRDFVEQSLVGLYMVQDGKPVYVNPRMAELLGYDGPEDLIGKSLTELTAPEDLPVLQENHRRRLSGEVGSVRYTYRALRRDGSRVWIEVHGSVSKFKGRPAVIGVALDVSRQIEFERQSRLANRVFEAASEGIVITDAEFRIEAVNPAFTRITGYRADEAVGKFSRMLTGTGAQINQQMLTSLAQAGHWQGEMRDRRKGGGWYPAWLSISTLRDPERNVTNYVGVFTDNTRRKETETRLQFLANHDSLTGMLNRSGMMLRFTEVIAQARASRRRLALMFVDLDRFKAVNDTLGHLAGDRLLKAAAERMCAELGATDIAARLGGDEFTVLLEDPPGSSRAEGLAARVIASMARPFHLNGQEVFVTASIGVARFPEDGEDAATLLQHADVAMYRAKERGRNICRFYTEDMSDHGLEQLMLENSLRRALERGEFELHYQQQIDTTSGRIAGIEALIRWRRPGVGLVPPAAFIELAERNGLIGPIGAWVLREACRQAREWMDAGLDFGRIAVNLSACQFGAGDLLDTIRDALDVTGLPATKLELEITESAIMQNPQEAIELLEGIRAMGVTLAVDDFGTGYSSLASLKQYPLDRLKIDRSFVSGIPEDADDIAITEAIIAVAHKMGLKVVAEGVETEAQLAFLRAAGCDFAQGYLHGKPQDAASIERLLAAAPVAA